MIQSASEPGKRKALCSEVKKFVAEDLPYVPLWYTGVVSVHAITLPVRLTPAGDYDFLVDR